MSPGDEAVWYPDTATIERANLTALMRERRLDGFAALHAWSITEREVFWAAVIDRLGIRLRRPPERLLDDDAGPERARWLSGAKLNITESCFGADPGADAVIHRRAGRIERVSYGELEAAVDQAAGGFAAAGMMPGSAVAIAMPMNLESVVAYLGIVRAGGTVVSVADSFAPTQIQERITIAAADTVVTQDVVRRLDRELPMYAKVVEAGADRCIVLDTGAGIRLRPSDLRWTDLMAAGGGQQPVVADPDTPTNILFSSGTTGEPKAIPWTHLTPIKAAMDGHFHQDIHPDEVVAWPTNLGWMMGPWLVYASLINRAALALFDDAPTHPEFGAFVADAGVTILGVVPSLVAEWRAGAVPEHHDWSRVRLFSSTGEASNAADMAYLMAAAGGRPVIEYCGGTEIGGGYLTGTVLHPAVPAAFSTPALGLDVRILDEAGRPAERGELFIVPPSIGLSTELLNRDHHQTYYAGTPSADVTLRRHGDEMERLANGYLRAHGRTDDTMNLGGIKVSSAEIERAVAGTAGLSDVAAVAAEAPGGGPSRLILFAVAQPGHDPEPQRWRTEMQDLIRRRLNPLFKVDDVVVVEALPRTASNKVMRRTLRDAYRQ